MNALELRIPPVALTLVFGAVMWAVAAATPSLAVPLPGRLLLALLVAGAGGLLALAGVLEFRRAGTTVNPTTPGASATVVSSGIYRFSRNPMYAGFLLALAGWAIFLAHSIALLMLPLFVAYMNRFQIAPEERALAAKFGPAYADYLRSVRRWL